MLNQIQLPIACRTESIETPDVVHRYPWGTRPDTEKRTGADEVTRRAAARNLSLGI